MNDRTRAIALLTRARDLLAEQLTDRVLQASDGILEDALGMSYMGEIDAIYEQLGVRLAHLNALIANLPPANEAASDEQPTSDEAEPTPTATNTASSLLALPAPRAAFNLPVPVDASRLNGLAIAVSGGSVTGNMLAELFGLAPQRGAHCWRHFSERLAHEPQTSLRAAQLVTAIATGNVGDALVLMWECFGLRGLESLTALQTLQGRLSAVR